MDNYSSIIHLKTMSIQSSEMCVIKRNGNSEQVSFDKILHRVQKVAVGANIHNIDLTKPCIKTIEQLKDRITTSEIDELMSAQCMSMSTLHPDYAIIAARLVVSNHHKNTNYSFEETMKHLAYHKCITQEVYNVCLEFKDQLNEIIDYSRDYLIDYFGFKTLEKSYLLKARGVIERIQHMWMRVSVGIHWRERNIDKIRQTYDLMSTKHFIHATPTLYNSGTNHAQMSSCFLLSMKGDSIDKIFDTIKDCAMISKHSGGIGMSVSNIRGSGSKIGESENVSSGIVPMLRVLNNTARYVDQGGKRKGAFAVYLETWHPDIQDFLNLKKNHGNEEMKARDLFYAMWISDVFMERVRDNHDWSLFCPSNCPDLCTLWGEEFSNRYCLYERNSNIPRKTVSARKLWLQILDAQMETGTPYLLYKDACNQKSNQQNLGTITCSNLCTEIVEFTSADQTAVCNLASIGLATFVDLETKEFDYDKLHAVTKVITENLNIIIDLNYYPTIEAKKSNNSNRPIGIGVQGLADVFVMMDVAFHSEQAKEINKNIFETIYHGALEQSSEMAKYLGSYESYVNSPASYGMLQFDLWGVDPTNNRYDWNAMKETIQRNGLYNSLLVAPMPTASTSQILGFNECFEPFTSNIYSRNTMAGEFVYINKYLIRELIKSGKWSETIKNSILHNRGSIQHLDFLSQHTKDKYKTVWEMPMKHIIDMSADRGAFICQSQSLNLWMEDPSYKTLTAMHMYGWKKGLKTGMYYLRRRAKHQVQQFTIEPKKYVSSDDLLSINSNPDQNSSENKDEEVCEMCSA